MDIRMVAIFSRASSVGMTDVKGPLVWNSSTREDTCFLKSSDWAKRPVLNFSCGGGGGGQDKPLSVKPKVFSENVERRLSFLKEKN